MLMDKFIDLIQRVTGDSKRMIEGAIHTIKSRIVGYHKVEDELRDEGVVLQSNSPEDALLELSSVWHEFESNKKIRVAEIIAGKYQMARFLVLMEELNEIK